MGYSKKLYNVLGGGYEYYNSKPNPICTYPEFTNITNSLYHFWYFFTIDYSATVSKKGFSFWNRASNSSLVIFSF